MQYSRFASESDILPPTAEELSRVYPHPTHRHQTSLPNLHDPHPVPSFAPYPYSLVPKEEMRQQYPPPPAGLEEQDYRTGENYSRGGDRSNPMVLSNPVPDYSVASASSPFTLQPQAPHFQPRPRPVINSYPLPRHDFDQQPPLPDPQQIHHLLPHQLPHHQMHHPLPHQHQHQQLHPDPRHIPYTTEWDFPGLPMRNGHDARLSEILSQPTPPHQYSNVPHLPMHDPYRNIGRDSPLLQHQPIDQVPNAQPAAAAYPADSYVQPISDDEAPMVNGKKPRKRRRLKGELPRDHALRKYQCLSCDQKFARPSALATHTLTHTKEKPFICGVCARGFAVSSNRSRHERVRHGVSPNGASPSANNALPGQRNGAT